MLFDGNRFSHRLTACLLIYALVVLDFVPFARALNDMEVRNIEFALRNYSNFDDVSTDHQSNVQANLELESLEGAFSPVPPIANAPGGGQVESSGFSIGSSDGLVDKFTGDFTYSLPLMNVEGYPITLSYNSNVTMMEEASWVGLGWNLNLGSVSREMRGIPDEFNGEQKVLRTLNIKDKDYELKKNGGYAGVGLNIKSFFYPSIQLTLLKGKYTDSYLGDGRTFDIGLGGSFSISEDSYLSPTLSIGYSYDSKNGSTINTGMGLSLNKLFVLSSPSVEFGKSFNSRSGVIDKSFGLSGVGTLKALSLGYGTSTTLNYGSITMVPGNSYYSKVTGQQTTTDIFVKFAGAQAGALIQRNKTNSNVNLDRPTISQPAIGYFHSGKRNNFQEQESILPIMDFNKSGMPEYSEDMTNLNFSMQTYDLFRVNASGVSGTFRGRRKDFGTYRDANTDSDVEIKSRTIKVGYSPPTTVIAGYSEGSNSGEAESGRFSVVGSPPVEFQLEANSDYFDQSVYFKRAGEATPEDIDALGYLGGANPNYVKLNQSGPNISLSNSLRSDLSASTLSVNPLVLNNLTDEIVQADYFKPYTAVERMQYPNAFIKKYNLNQFPPTSVSNVARNGGAGAYRENNHLSEIETIGTNGMRYHFGIPAYTKNESTVVFAATGLSVDATTGIVAYNTGDNSVSNMRGRANYFEKTTVPAYAHSFLLTEVLSPDYIDRLGDGPSVDDVGTYYKFNYTQVYGENTLYKSRFPVAGGTSGKEAIFNKGLLGSSLDDTGNYTYAEKEIWYTHSIETKNLVAEFHLKARKDAFGVLTEDGVLNSSTPLYALDSIVLYNKADREVNGSAAIPLQTVVFEYDYSLCKNAPANKHTYSPNIDYNESGKLTLKHVRIFGGKSSESGLRSYDFTYSANNPEFNYAAVDGWGNYKPNNTSVPNDIFPYAVQDETSAEANTDAWKLISIENPAGGRIDIQYEPDSYGYVQDKRAMRHFEVEGLTNVLQLLKTFDEDVFDPGDLVNDMSSNITSLASGIGGSSFIENPNRIVKYAQDFGIFDFKEFPNNVVVFKLEDAIDGGLSYEAACDQVKTKYFREKSENGWKPLSQLFMKLHYTVKGSVKEYMPVFLDISADYNYAFNNLLTIDDGFKGVGVLPPVTGLTDYTYGYVVVNPIGIKKNRNGSKKFAKNPMQKAAVEFSRMNLPDIVYGACATCIPNNSIDNSVILGKDINYAMMELDYGSSISQGLTTVRLYEPDDVKFGGNSRVNQIIYSDNWNAISGEYESTYSWTYQYPGRSQNFGVSTNEPRALRDESPLYNWITYENVIEKFPNELMHTPTPVTELLYPDAVVGYQETGVQFNSSAERGYSSTSFYTARDYPVIAKQTSLHKESRYNDKDFIPVGKTVDVFGLTQGYSIVTNEWHGAIRSSKLVDGQDNLLSQSTYIYYGAEEPVKMIDREGSIENKRVALEYDVHGEENFSRDKTKMLTVGVTLSWKLPWPIPFPMPNFFLSSRERGFYSYVLNKHLNYTPQVKSIQTINMQSVNVAENLAYDYHTGDVLVSSLKDEFDDKLYSVSTPGHWYYEPFKEVSGVNGFSCIGTISSSILTVAPANKPKFNVGDKLFVHNGGTVYSAWISEIDGSGNFILIDITGSLFTILSGSITAIIAKSLRQNRLSDKIQQAVTKRTPDIYDAQFEFPDTTVISSSAITFGERNSYICGTAGEGVDNDVSPGSTFNPFLYGTKGNLVPDGQYSWQSERIQADHEHGIRFDGAYSDFVPFYQINESDDSWYRINESSHPDYNGGDLYQKWRKGGEIAWFDEFGKPIESKDQIGVHSAVLYSYNNEAKLLPVAQAVNAKLQEIAFDGFEDYDLNLPTLNSDQTHFDYKAAIGSHVSVSSSIRHSGRASLKVDPGYLASVSKLVGTLCDEKSTLTSEETFTVDSCLCIPPFQPTPGDYILSVWVKVDTTANVLDYSDAEVEVDISGTGSANYLFTADGPILDGWQRLEGEFNIPSNAAGITVKLKNESGTQDVYFDDLRIHPFLAGMTTNVYHPQTLLPIASHDGYNFTTFYNYDENLNQVRVRVETSEGIKTIVETETGGKKNYSPQ